MDDNPYRSPETWGAGQKLPDGIRDRLVPYSSVVYLFVLLVGGMLFIEGGGQPTPQLVVALIFLVTPPIVVLNWLVWKRFWRQ